MRRTILTFTAAITVGIAAIATPPTGYYAGLNGKKGASLKEAAKEIVASHEILGNNRTLWEAFETTDTRTSGGKIQFYDIFSDTFTPVDAESHNLVVELLVPLTWWGGDTSSPAYTDLFNIIPTAKTVSGARSAYPLGKVVETVFDNGVVKVGKPASGDCNGARKVFEPSDRFKGDVARAYMYVFTLYDDLDWAVSNSAVNYMFDGRPYPSLLPWASSLLLEWNELDPVSDEERARNEAVYNIQKNRNPFIDNPDMAAHIWGDKSEDPFLVGDYPDEPGTDPGDSDPQGFGTLDLPYNVDYVLTSRETETDKWVLGYVVGYFSGFEFTSGCRFSGDVTGANYIGTNIVLASDPACTDISRCIPVALSTPEMREGLGLIDAPEVYGKKVKVRGTIGRYSDSRGVYETTAYSITGEVVEGVEPTPGDADGMLRLYPVWGGGPIICSSLDESLAEGVYIIRQDNRQTKKIIIH